MHFGPLSEEHVKSWTSDNADNRGGDRVYERKIRNELVNQEILQNESKQRYRYQRISPFVNNLLLSDNRIRRVMHIGGRIDTLSAFFSEKYQNRKFMTVDMQSNLQRINDRIGGAATG